MKIASRSLLSLLVAAMPLVFAGSVHAGVMDKLKNAADKHAEKSAQPVKVPIASGTLTEHGQDMKKLMAAFKKKIGTYPFNVYGVLFNWNNQVSVVYQSLTDREKLEMLIYAKGEIEGVPRPFKLANKDAKVSQNVFDFNKVKLDVIPDLVKTAREKTAEATKAKRTYGVSVRIVQAQPVGPEPKIRIMVSVASDESSNELVGGLLNVISDNRPAKSAPVGLLVADETGKVLGFRVK